jgi:hypothetical protein
MLAHGHPFQSRLSRVGDSRMTYVAAFECKSGIVMCADTQETHLAPHGQHSDEKEYVEKLYVPENTSYPIAIGGAGLDEPIEAFSQELFGRIEKEKPTTIHALRTVIQSSIDEVHKSDIVVSAWPEMYRTTKCIIAAKPTDEESVIFVVTGKRVSYRKREPVIVGYDTPVNRALMKRLYRADLSIQQGVILALYLVAQSKAVNEGVGFDTKVVVITSTGAWPEAQSDIAEMEDRFTAITPYVDRLLLAAPDVGTTEEQFDDIVKEFHEAVRGFRFSHKERVAEQIATGQINWPYEKLPTGSSVMQSFNDKGQRIAFIYSDPVDRSSETWALRIAKNGKITFKQTQTAYLRDGVYQRLISCPFSSLTECNQNIIQDAQGIQ